MKQRRPRGQPETAHRAEPGEMSTEHKPKSSTGVGGFGNVGYDDREYIAGELEPPPELKVGLRARRARLTACPGPLLDRPRGPCQHSAQRHGS